MRCCNSAERVRTRSIATPTSTSSLRSSRHRDRESGDDDGADFELTPRHNRRIRAAGVRARQTHFSASALNAYAECARKWYYRYVCAAVEDAPSSASTYGTAFHAALEDFHGEFPQPTAARRGGNARTNRRLRELGIRTLSRQFETPSNSNCSSGAHCARQSATSIGCSPKPRARRSQ